MKKKKQVILNGNMQYRKLNTLIPHPENPRFITKDGYETLKYSIQTLPDYFEGRPLLLSDRTGELVVIAGNQRFLIAKELELEEVPTHLIPNLTIEKENEIMIRDNVNNGKWNWDEIANNWDAEIVHFYGLDLPLDYNDNEEWYIEEEKEKTYSITIVCKDEIEQSKSYTKLIADGYNVKKIK